MIIFNNNVTKYSSKKFLKTIMIKISFPNLLTFRLESKH